MKKTPILFLIFVFTMNFAFALDLNIQKNSSNEVFVLGLNRPAVFNLDIKNLGPSDYLVFYSFFSQNIFPKGTVYIESFETKRVPVEIYPPKELRNLGNLKFDLYIRGQKGDEIAYPILLRVVSLDEAFAVTSDEITSESKQINIYLENKINFEFDNLHVVLTSPFFEDDEIISLQPYEIKKLTVKLDKKKFESLKAGFYTLNAKITAEDVSANVDGKIIFRETKIITTTKNNYGFIVNTQIMSKINEGNVPEKTEIVFRKNIISRLLTTFSPEPNISERKGFFVYYSWEKELQPGERFDVRLRTNWLFPFMVILFLVLFVYLLKEYTKKDLILRKRVSFVRAKGGEFALKISVIVSSRRFVEKVSVIENLPHLVKLHEKFGMIRPSKIDLVNKKLEWQFDKLEEGETRILTYIVYSKIGIVGKFALPRATAVFERDGEVKEIQSNRTYFMSEQRALDKEE